MSQEILVVTCPDCGKKHRVAAKHEGKLIACQGCEKRLRVKASGAAAPSQQPKAASDQNPYAASNAASGSRESLGSDAVDSAIIEPLEKTRPWVRLIGAIFLVGFVLGAVVIAMAIYQMMSPVPGGGPVGTGTLLAPIVIAQAVSLVLNFLSAQYLRSYSKSISELGESGSQDDLVAALNHQRRFWTLHGVLAAIVLVVGSLFALFLVVTRLLMT